MKKRILILLSLICLLLLAGCTCEHEWLHATGGHGQICDCCGEYQDLDEPCNYPAWETPDCENPRQCINCGKPEAEAKPHTWTNATEETPMTCSVCGKTNP